MTSIARRFTGDVVVYGLGATSLQLIGFVTLPIVSRALTPEQYGTLDVATSLLTAALFLSLLGLDSACQRSYFDQPPDAPAEQERVISTTFWSLIVSSAVVAAVIALVRRPLADWLFDDPSLGELFGIVAATLPVLVLMTFGLEVLRMRRLPWRYSLVAITGGVAGAVVGVTLLTAFDEGVPGYLTGLLIGSAAALLLGLVLIRRTIHARFDRGELRVMLRYGLPLVPVAASAWVVLLVDRFFLARYSTLEELGLYGMGVRLSSVLLLVVSAVSLAWTPFVLELHRDDEQRARTVTAHATSAVLFVLCLGAVCLTTFAREFFVTFTDPSFADSREVVGLLTAGIVAVGFSAVAAIGISLSRQTRWFARYAVAVAVLNLALNFALIPPWGMIGAAIATAVSQIALALLYVRRAQLLHPVPMEYRRLVAIVVPTAVALVLGSVLYLDSTFWSVVAKIPLVLAWLAVVWLLGGVDREWVKLARGFLPGTHGPEQAAEAP